MGNESALPSHVITGLAPVIPMKRGAALFRTGLAGTSPVVMRENASSAPHPDVLLTMGREGVASVHERATTFGGQPDRPVLRPHRG
ncbi:hypothetical protein J4G37_02380 [Microvirga sp. 3-52]|nr:hypothetical protein [Microvirga sp. 3-52]